MSVCTLLILHYKDTQSLCLVPSCYITYLTKQQLATSPLPFQQHDIVFCKWADPTACAKLSVSLHASISETHRRKCLESLISALSGTNALCQVTRIKTTHACQGDCAIGLCHSDNGVNSGIRNAIWILKCHVLKIGIRFIKFSFFSCCCEWYCHK